ncbi:MAG: Protein kinase domain, partial [Chlamydiota bacterium]
KVENILIYNDGPITSTIQARTPRAAITDFDCTSQGSRYLPRGCGTPASFSPERRLEGYSSPEDDVYAMGRAMLISLTDISYYIGYSSFGLPGDIDYNDLKQHLIDKGLGRFADILCAMLHPYPRQRPTAAQCRRQIQALRELKAISDDVRSFRTQDQQGTTERAHRIATHLAKAHKQGHVHGHIDPHYFTEKVLVGSKQAGYTRSPIPPLLPSELTPAELCPKRLLFFPPEVLQVAGTAGAEHFKTHATQDIWSLGLCMLHSLTGVHYFVGDKAGQRRYEELRHMKPEHPIEPTDVRAKLEAVGCNLALTNLVVAMLSTDPKQRPTASHVRNILQQQLGPPAAPAAPSGAGASSTT